MKRALITGINGMDGSHLADLLLEKGYEVYGMERRTSSPNRTNTSHLEGKITFVNGDLTDQNSLLRCLKESQPDEVYNLGSQSFVGESWNTPEQTGDVTGLGVLRMLEAIREYNKDIKFYQASSSEMFGRTVDEDGYQRETTPMHPTSPYGCTKVFGFNMVVHYRYAYNLFAVNGILFNHESPRRGSNFVTNKVVKSAVEIKKGLEKELPLGNLDAYRDWGHSKDYVRAMHMIMNHTEPDDFGCATGVTNSVGDMCKYVFSKLGMDYKDYVTQDPRYMRSEELKYLRGDSTKLRTTFGWEPEYTFETLMDEMIDHWMGVYEEF